MSLIALPTLALITQEVVPPPASEPERGFETRYGVSGNKDALTPELQYQSVRHMFRIMSFRDPAALPIVSGAFLMTSVNQQRAHELLLVQCDPTLTHETGGQRSQYLLVHYPAGAKALGDLVEIYRQPLPRPEW